MAILNEVDKPGSDIDLYVNSLDKLLLEKQNKIINLRKKLYNLYTKLKDEEALSNKFSIINDTSKILEKENNLSDSFDNEIQISENKNNIK